jgi:hypothetical protein
MRSKTSLEVGILEIEDVTRVSVLRQAPTSRHGGRSDEKVNIDHGQQAEMRFRVCLTE